MAVCGMCCINLYTDPLKVLGTKFCYNKKLREESKVNHIITDIQRVLKIWKMRKLTLEGKIVSF